MDERRRVEYEQVYLQKKERAERHLAQKGKVKKAKKKDDESDKFY